MKVLHINTLSHGGAFTGTYRLHQALIKSGVSSKIIVRDVPLVNNLEEVYVYHKFRHKPTFINRLLSNIGLPVTLEQKKWLFMKGRKGDFEIVSFPFSDFDITRSKEYCEADIIHLHWIAEFIDYPTFLKNNRKPVVWTLRDSFPILGIFHLQNDYEKNSDEWKALDNKMSALKKKLIQRSAFPLIVVGLSNWITEKSLSGEMFKAYSHEVIPNCIDIENFKRIDKTLARKILNVDNNKIVLCFGTESERNVNKGYAELLQALDSIENKDLELVSFGGSISLSCHYSLRHRYLGKLNNEQLSVVFSASDAFIFPTREEALGNVMLEAMACGTPVIGTPVGGLLDVIKPGFNGLLSKDLSSEGLRESILEFVRIRNSFDREAIRNYIAENFSEELISRKYIDIYSSLLKQ